MVQEVVNNISNAQIKLISMFVHEFIKCKKANEEYKILDRYPTLETYLQECLGEKYYIFEEAPDGAELQSGSIWFYAPQKNWEKIKQHLKNARLREVLRRDFSLYTVRRYGIPFKGGTLPIDYWDFDIRKRCRVSLPPCDPQNWRSYAKPGAAPWLVNFNLVLASLVEPWKPWRIIASDKHCTVWDGDSTLFDLTGMATVGNARTCLRRAVLGANSRELAPLETLDPGVPELHPLYVKVATGSTLVDIA